MAHDVAKGRLPSPFARAASPLHCTAPTSNPKELRVMRTHLVHGLAAAVALALAACSNTYPQQPKDPINADPKPQAPITQHSPQQNNINVQHERQGAVTQHDPQQSQWSTPGGQQTPASDPEPQKPFYGPGLVPPEQRDAEQAKAKAPLGSDGEILSFAMAVNDGEVQMAEMAKKSADAAAVKE